MRLLPLLALLAACSNGSIKVGDSGGADTEPVAGDEDGDGYPGLEAGGTDCDDADPTVYPGASETWYDGVDGDCDGGSDYDQDGDGADGGPDGVDCDDLDASVYPGVPEVRDMADQDCDGLVDEDFVAAGDVVVTEVMHHPLAASDADGEWFELSSTVTEAIDLQGWTISADDGDRITIEGSLVLEPGRHLVLGTNGNTGFNGGVAVDYVYDRAQLSLSAEDTLFLQVGTSTVFDIEWGATWNMTDGRSIGLDPDHNAVLDARQSGFWCSATSPLGTGDYGTPGVQNDDCTALDEDGDGYSVDRGDCDDDDATVSPGAPDIWDGVDNDCSGAADDGDAGDAAVGAVDGPNNGFLSVHAGLGVGDVTGDGTPDLLVGGALQSTYKGAMYVLDGADASALDGDAADYAVASVTGSTYGYFGAVDPVAGDVTGDGTVDLVVASGGTNGAGGTTYAVGVFEGGSGLSGEYDPSDADLRITGSTSIGAYGNNRVLSHLDYDGDGVADVIYGAPNVNDGSSFAKGKVYFFAGDDLDGTVGLDDAETTLTGDSAQDYLGIGLGGGDVDGDGYDDVFLGAIGQDDYATNGGCWYQIAGRATPYGALEVDNAEARTLSGTVANGMVGYGAPAVADFDRDGYADVAFGAMDADTVWIFYGLDATTTNLDTNDADVALTGEANFGFSVTAGDFDGDGGPDLAVGAPNVAVSSANAYYWYATPGPGYGALYLFDGSRIGRTDRDTSFAFAAATGESTGDLFGAVLGGAASFVGDRADDLLVGAPRHGNGAGRVYAFQGQ